MKIIVHFCVMFFKCQYNVLKEITETGYCPILDFKYSFSRTECPSAHYFESR